ncbi:secondary thiamine-phosphate synthase enzyme YjbQ [Guyparkeria sp. 1SP6A2]|nr:secondary thiamine-phosphate synthase enzyme YjbQ [Guyparkeria sp. 1SP6A2]
MPKIIEISTSGRGFTNITRAIEREVTGDGLCHLFLQHTSASLVLTENASPEVPKDLETLIGRIAPDGDPAYRHDDEGPDDMAAHFRTLMAGHDLSIPVADGRLLLGTWQGIFLWEHRSNPHRRRIVITVLPEAT